METKKNLDQNNNRTTAAHNFSLHDGQGSSTLQSTIHAVTEETMNV